MEHFKTSYCVKKLLVLALILLVLVLVVLCLAGCSAAPAENAAAEQAKTPEGAVSVNRLTTQPDIAQQEAPELTEEPKEPEDQTPAAGTEPTADINWAYYQTADMSGYKYLKENIDRFKVMTAWDVCREIDAGKSFLVLFSHENCPWCQAAVPVIADFAEKHDLLIGYVDTRADPMWKSNTHIDNYDLLCEHIGEYFTQEEEGPHLYVPDLYFIRSGEVAFTHKGAATTYDGSSGALTEDQADELMAILEDGYTFYSQKNS